MTGARVVLIPLGERNRDEAGIVMLKVGLGLVDDARRSGGFETDAAKLTARAGEILESLRAAGSNPGGVAVSVAPEDSKQVRLSIPAGEHGSDGVLLRADGTLLERFTAQGEPEAERAEWAEQVEPETFRGQRFLQALAFEPQPGAEVQLLAVELFDDGLVVHYSFEQSQEEFEASFDEDPLDDLGAPQGLKVEDDLGTEYRHRSGGGGSAGVVRSSYSFTPAVPEAARILRISTRSGTVELPLRD